MNAPSSMTAAELPSAELGVYFFPEDYAGLGRRMAILALDFIVLLVACVFLVVFYAMANGLYHQKYGIDLTPLPFFLGFLAVCWTYLAVIEGLVGTLGFLSADVKIVNLRGERPSIWRMTFRLLICVLFGIFMPVYDLIWLAGDANWQSLRDKLAGTLVVRRDAIPAGGGPIKLRRMMFLGMSLAYFEVKNPERPQGAARSG
jgi:uncharacterized RDD family membrane protein YckC